MCIHGDIGQVRRAAILASVDNDESLASRQISYCVKDTAAYRQRQNEKKNRRRNKICLYRKVNQGGLGIDFRHPFLKFPRFILIPLSFLDSQPGFISCTFLVAKVLKTRIRKLYREVEASFGSETESQQPNREFNRPLHSGKAQKVGPIDEVLSI